MKAKKIVFVLLTAAMVTSLFSGVVHAEDGEKVTLRVLAGS